MEYVQAVLFQIPADKLDEASRPQGLLAELDEHRKFLYLQPGFQDMRVIRSINPEGDVQLVVETRWRDDESLLDYETREPTVMSIVSKYRDLLVPGSLQVADMEAVRPQARREPERERIALPLLVPAGILAFVLLVIYGLSRIYLEIRPAEIRDLSVATPLALAIAAGILGVSWYLATHPGVSGWQIGAIIGAALALLLGGALFAAIHEEEGEAAEGVTPPPVATPAPSPAGPAAGTEFSIAMIPSIRFNTDTITIPANTPLDILADNQDTGVPHNLAVYTEEGGDLIGKTDICSAPCQKTLTLELPPGDYFFRCDVHPTQMVGTLVVQ
jgi:plastocyanin